MLHDFIRIILPGFMDIKIGDHYNYFLAIHCCKFGNCCCYGYRWCCFQKKYTSSVINLQTHGCYTKYQCNNNYYQCMIVIDIYCPVERWICGLLTWVLALIKCLKRQIFKSWISYTVFLFNTHHHKQMLKCRGGLVLVKSIYFF